MHDVFLTIANGVGEEILTMVMLKMPTNDVQGNLEGNKIRGLFKVKLYTIRT